MYEMICKHCGSSDDLEFNACGYWDPHEEDYEWFSIEAYCHKCGDMVVVNKIEIKTKRNGNIEGTNRIQVR